MTLIDDLANVTKANNLCSVKQLLNSLPKNEAVAIEKVIDDPDTSPTALSRTVWPPAITAARDAVLANFDLDAILKIAEEQRREGNLDLLLTALRTADDDN
jgi:hypothetical protein